MGDRDTDFRMAKRVRLTVACVYLDCYPPSDDQGVIAKASGMLDEHNIELDLWPDNGQKFAFNTLKTGWSMVPDDDDAYKKLRAAVDKVIENNGCTFIIPLPVVFCMFEHRGHGITPPAMKKKLTHACLISNSVNKDKVTMVHEWGMQHLHHVHGSDNRGNFMHEAEPRSFMYRYQGEKMAKAVFSI